jgi:hypothetical protein
MLCRRPPPWALGLLRHRERLLHFDGEVLWLGEGDARRAFADNERDSLMPVAANNRIPECRGFDIIVLAGPDA